MSLNNLPHDLILEIFERQNLDEIRGLCGTNKQFRSYCNHFARKQLTSLGSDFYELYIKLSQFHLCIHTYEGDIRFAKCHKDQIINSVRALINQVSGAREGADISYKTTNDTPIIYLCHLNIMATIMTKAL